MHSVLQVFCIECGLGGLEKHDGSVGNCRDEVKPFDRARVGWLRVHCQDLSGNGIRAHDLALAMSVLGIRNAAWWWVFEVCGGRMGCWLHT